MIKRKAVFLDRDGIINNPVMLNGKPYPPLKIINTQPVKGAKELVKSLHEAGYLVLVMTNQPDVGNHIITKSRIETINNYLKSLLNFDDIFTCYHTEADMCDCREPNLGLFVIANIKYNIDFHKSYVVGNRKSSIDAGKKLGSSTIFLDCGYDEEKPECPDYTVDNLEEIPKILEKELHGKRGNIKQCCNNLFL